MPFDVVRAGASRTSATLDARASLHQRLTAYVPSSEIQVQARAAPDRFFSRPLFFQKARGGLPLSACGLTSLLVQRFTRTLAALEAHHTNELHAQTRIAYESKLKGDAADGHAAVLRHAALAKEAKKSCQMEALRAEGAARDRRLVECEAQLAAALARAELAETGLLSTESALGQEVHTLEIELSANSKLLRDFQRAHELKSEHLLTLQQQTAKSATMLAQMQEQATSMQKRLAAQQRKSMRLQESQVLVNASAKSWQNERKQLVEQVASANQMAREAIARQQILEADHGHLIDEVRAVGTRLGLPSLRSRMAPSHHLVLCRACNRWRRSAMRAQQPSARRARWPRRLRPLCAPTSAAYRLCLML